MYTGGIMKYFRNIAVSGLIVAIVSLAGGLCLVPMPVRAMDVAGGHIPDESMDTVSGNDHLLAAWGPCIIHCASQIPEAMAAKPFSVDVSADIFFGALDVGDSRLPSFFFGDTDRTGTHPPALDMLASVFKKE